MYIYLDDSGNIDGEKGNLYLWLGFSIKSGSKRLEEKLNEVFSDFTYDEKDGELKGSKATFEQKKEVFERLASWDNLRISYLVVDKSIVTEAQSKFVKDTDSRKKEQSENYFLSKVVSRLAVPYEDATDKKVVLYIDGKAGRGKESEVRLHEYLTLRINFPKWNKDQFAWNNFGVNYVQEKNNRLVQTADFLANFVLEHYKLMYYKEKKNKLEICRSFELYSIIEDKIYHKIYGFPNISLV
ncbi:DUF3800 domain-containing protein [Pseudalkalibacillus hwajinpoensis]|uniref:DUF3800 domain-containing protein n=1 Tax=Guptibacillus hwajinpoensis TaxID=208199 RepID=UPI00146B919F|nr:DUF3800 domain-containing protein [Pseudalkalibacillus hwajinpoensis]